MSGVAVGAALAGHGNTTVSVLLGLAGVFLSRLVFVDRENKKLGRHQTIRETLPLTMVAMLITGVVIWDNNISYSPSVFTGLGIGWSAITILEVVGKRIVDPGADRVDRDVEKPRAVKMRDAPNGLETPPDMIDLLRDIDRADRYRDAKPKRLGDGKPGP